MKLAALLLLLAGCAPLHDQLVIHDPPVVHATYCGPSLFVWGEYQLCSAKSLLAGHPECVGAASNVVQLQPGATPGQEWTGKPTP